MDGIKGEIELYCVIMGKKKEDYPSSDDEHWQGEFPLSYGSTIGSDGHFIYVRRSEVEQLVLLYSMLEIMIKDAATTIIKDSFKDQTKAQKKLLKIVLGYVDKQSNGPESKIFKQALKNHLAFDKLQSKNLIRISRQMKVLRDYIVHNYFNCRDKKLAQIIDKICDIDQLNLDLFKEKLAIEDSIVLLTALVKAVKKFKKDHNIELNRSESYFEDFDNEKMLRELKDKMKK